MRSMTGFGQANVDGVSVAVSAVNHRNTQVQVRGNLRDAALEDQVRRRVLARLGRGACTVQIQIERRAEQAWDEETLRDRWRALAALAAAEGAPPPRIEAVAAFVLRSGEGDDAALREPVLAALDAALADFDADRQREGASLATALAEARQAMADLRERVAQRAAGRGERHRDRLHERLREVLGEQPGIEPEHLIRELAIYADRIDISEELVRWQAHLDALAAVLAEAGDEPCGKRLDFLLQETGREINTTGSKANDAALAQMVVDAKSLLESMREQAANVW